MTNFYHSLATLLTKELELYRKIRDLLSQEYGLLESRKIDDLPQLTEHKQLILLELNNVAQKRQRVIANYPTQGATLEQTLDFAFAGAPQSMAQSLKKQWQTIQQQLQDCKHQNELNGRIINRSKRNVEKMLQTLRGGRGQAQTYDRHGHTNPYESSIGSVKA